MNPLMIPSIIGTVGEIIGGGVSAGSQMWENQKNRDFQERMSNTAYQRSIADMQKAGINPALAFSQGGASSPAGNTGNVGQLGQSISRSARALMERKSKAEINQQELLNENIKLKNSALAQQLKSYNKRS